MTGKGTRWLISILGSLALLFAGMVLDGWWKGVSAVYETRQFAMMFVQRFASGWDPALLEKHAHPGLLQVLQQAGQTPQGITALYAKLGTLQKFEGCAVESAGAFVGAPAYRLAQYKCKIATEHADATIIMQLRKDATHPWQIIALSVTSPYFQQVLKPNADKQKGSADKEKSRD